MVQVIRVLLRHDRGLLGVVDPDGRTALHWACKHPNTKSLDVLLKSMAPAVLNAQDKEQVTALHWTIMCQHLEHLVKLLKAGANARVTDHEGRTPIHYAVSSDTPKCLRALLEADEEAVNMRDARGRAPLHLAISASVRGGGGRGGGVAIFWVGFELGCTASGGWEVMPVFVCRARLRLSSPCFSARAPT